MGNITELSQGSLNGLRRQLNECIENAYNKGYADGKKEIPEKAYYEAKIDQAKQEGYDIGYNNAFEDLKEVWECDNIDEFMQYKYQCIMEITYMLERYRPQDVIACFKEWRKQKKQAEEEIKVGDEVKDCFTDNIGVVMGIGNLVVYITKNGVYTNALGSVEKTGRHFDEVSQLLDKLKEIEND